MRRKTGLIVLIVMLAIGFAAVSTNLIVNGTGVFVTNEEDFKVIFSKAILDEIDVTDTTISEDGQSLTFVTKDLALKDDTSELLFEVRNNSTQYDAKISMECVANGEHANEYYKIEKNIPEVIMGGKRATGSVKVTLMKTSVEEIEETFTCTITATATERTETAKLGVIVTAKDASDNDLKATSDEITGDKETELLNALVEDGYITSADDVNALIDVKSDSFDNVAYTTFDVSNIAEPGDTIVIMHYNETTDEWEYIGTKTVDEFGMINEEFTSFSPVALIVVPEDGNLQSHTKHIDNDIDGICDICKKQGEVVNVYHEHTGSKTAKGGCYTTPVNHVHSYSCYYRAYKGDLVPGGGVYRYYTCSHCGYCKIEGDGVNDNGVSSYECPTCKKNNDYACKKSTSTIESYSLSCGKDENTIDSQYTVFE